MNTIISAGVGVLVFCMYFVAQRWPDDLVKASDIVWPAIGAYIAAVVCAAILKLWGV